MKALKIGSIFALSALLFACATETVVYSPKSDPTQVTPQLNLADAKKATENAVRQDRWVLLGNAVVTSFTVTSTQVSYRYEFPTHPETAPVDCIYVYGSQAGLTVVENYQFRVQLTNGCTPEWNDRDSAVQFVNGALSLEKYFMMDHSAEIEAEISQFKSVAENYRSKHPRPGISEEARRYQVQAENAFDEKRYDDAVLDYRKALEIAPWWPDGRYNLALLLGQKGNFLEADIEMKKYLELAPDAPDARKARDKTYVWEGKLPSKTANPPSTAPTQASPAVTGH